MNLDVRRADPDELEACATLAAGVAQRMFPWEPLEKNTPAAKLAVFRKETVHAAFEDGRVVGVISLWEPDAFVHYLFAEPQSRGIGLALLKAAAQLSDRPLTLKCADANHRALSFYERLGFVAIEHGEDDVHRWVRLKAPQAGL